MARYKKNNYNDFSTRISRGSYQQDEDTLFDTLKRLIILGVAICLGGLVSLKAYLTVYNNASIF